MKSLLLALSLLVPALPVAAQTADPLSPPETIPRPLAEAVAPPAPEAGPELASIKVGVLCALRTMDQIPAPGTDTGWIHVPLVPLTFHWPDRQIVPASLGIAFGVQVIGQPGFGTSAGESRVFRPGRTDPERWSAGVSDAGDTLSFFRFDSEEEMVPGRWVFEGWDGETRLYRAEFEVVDAALLPEIALACGATS